MQVERWNWNQGRRMPFPSIFWLTIILVYSIMLVMAWRVEVKPSVLDDLRHFGRKSGRVILQEAIEILGQNPMQESKNLKCLRPNLVAQRQLKVFGKYRVLFSVDEKAELVDIVLVGEKQGNTLLVRGEEFTDHHESHPSE